FVDDDIALRVDLDACGFEPEVVGIRATTDGEQHMRAQDLGLTGHAIDADRNLRAARFELDAFGLEPNFYAFRLQDFADRIRDLFVLALNQPRRLFDNRDFRSQASKNLCE